MEFDFTEILQAAQNPATFFVYIILKGGWVLFVIFFVYAIPIFWLEWRRSLFDSKREYIMLAIDIPRNNEQSPKAVEHLFEHLSGAQTTPKLEDKWMEGKLPESFSLEIISLGGYIQFLIRTPIQFRDLVEAAMYAQYPDAEIMEVDDYTEPFKGMKFPHDDYNVWGTELKLANKEFYPIRTYIQFEHPLSQELKDPMATLMEILSKLEPDEQIWLQFVVTPASDKWKNEGQNLVKKLIGSKVTQKQTLVGALGDAPMKILGGVGDIIAGGAAKEQTKPDLPSLMQHISPGTRGTVEAIERKMSKIGFYTRVRFIYITKKEAFNPDKRVDAVMGAFRQFADLDNNRFAHHVKKRTKVYLFFKKYRLNYRRTRILRLYRMRSRHYTPGYKNYMGYYGYVLNTEELASLYHFPVSTVKAPLIKKTEAKRAEPPITLPVE